MHTFVMMLALSSYGVATFLFMLVLAGIWHRGLVVAKIALTVAATAHLAAIGAHHLAGLEPPILSMAGILNLLVFTAVVAYLVANLFYRTTLVGGVLAPLATVVVGALFSHSVPDAPIRYQAMGFVTPVHIASSSLAFLTFLAAFVVAIVFLVADRRLRDRRLLEATRLPSIAVLERAMDILVRVGFALYTVGVILGTVWVLRQTSEFNATQYWIGLAVWFLFAGLVYASVRHGWRGRKAAVLTMIGFAALVPIVLMYVLRRIG